jgi:SnoaL-like polyketide cyclase
LTVHRVSLDRLLAIWNGEADLDELDALVAPSYVGHIGSRDRDLGQLKQDIVDYRAKSPGVVFRVEHQFGAGGYLATRLTARTEHASEQTISGMNISRWQDGVLTEEWAVWESFGVT